MPAPLEQIPLLVRAGTVLPKSERVAYVSAEKDTTRTLSIYPIPGVASASTEIFDDDGESYSYPDGRYMILNVEMKCTNENIALTIKKTGTYSPAYKTLTLYLPTSESRTLTVNGKAVLAGESITLDSLE